MSLGSVGLVFSRPLSFVGRQWHLATMDAVEVSVKFPVESSAGESFVSFEVYAVNSLSLVAKSSRSAFSFRAPKSVNLNFVGRTAHKRMVALSPTSLAFGRQDVQEECRALAVVENATQKDAVAKLGFRLLTTNLDDVAIFRGQGGVESVVGVHWSTPELLQHLLSDNAAAANPPWFTLQTISMKVSPRAFAEATATAGRGLSKGSPILAIQNMFAEMYEPGSDDQLRLLVITAPANYVLNRARNAKTALAGARPLTVEQWANLAYASQMGVPWDIGGSIFGDSPYMMALPRVIWGRTSGVVPGAMQSGNTLAYVELTVTRPDTWASLLSLPAVDVVLNVINPGGQQPLRACCFARVHGDPRDVGRAFNSLPHPRKLVQGVVGLDSRHLEHVHHETLPGSTRVTQGTHYSFLDWSGGVSAFAEATDAQGSEHGDLPIGRNSHGRVVLLDSSMIHSILFSGTSGNGKTTLAVAMAFGMTRNVAVIHFATPKQVWAQEMMLSLGGFTMPFDDSREITGPADFAEAVKEINAHVASRADEIIAASKKAKRLIGFPCVFHYVRGNTYLYLAWCLAWLDALARISEAGAELGERMVVIVDDVLSAATSDKDAVIKEESESLGNSVRIKLHQFINTCRQFKTRTFITVQSLSSFMERFGRDFWDTIPIALSVSQYKKLLVWEPANTEPNALAAYEKELNELRKTNPTAELSPGGVPGFRYSVGFELPEEMLELLKVPPAHG